MENQPDSNAELTIAVSKALRADARAPLFILVDSSGHSVALEDLLCRSPVVLHFFRGVWCSFGEDSLLEFSATLQSVLALGASAVAITPPSKVVAPGSALPILALVDFGIVLLASVDVDYRNKFEATSILLAVMKHFLDRTTTARRA